MDAPRRIDSGHRTLIRIVDAAMAEAARKSGAWLACRPGCHQCCTAPFPITALDAHRLRRGLAELEDRDPARAASVRRRVREAVARMAPEFPGDTRTGILGPDEEAEDRFCEEFENETCPALDPDTGTCDLYAARPMTCRTFGPAVRCNSGAIGVCELCYQGVTDTEIARCEVAIDPEGLEAALLEEMGERGQTVVAFALVLTAPIPLRDRDGFHVGPVGNRRPIGNRPLRGCQPRAG